MSDKFEPTAPATNAVRAFYESYNQKDLTETFDTYISQSRQSRDGWRF